METNKKPIIIIALSLIIAAVIIFIILTLNKDKNKIVQPQPNNTENLATDNQPGNIENNNAGSGNNVSREKVEVAPETASNQNEESVAINEENVEENKKTSVPENTPNLQQRMDATNPISGVLKIKVADNAFNPMTFYVEAGSKITISFTNTNELKHTIAFKDSSLSNVNISVDAGKTKDLSFTAPSIPGTYYFYCATDNHEANGEMGKMIVK